jgi:hypothetical protein
MPVTSSVRHTAANSIVSHSSTPDGTICVGKNWRVLEYTGELCSVMPFSKDYNPTPNIPVARCATTYTCPDSGQSILLIADQVLYFGDSMEHTLINPHQIRSHGYSLCDDPWDPNRTLGLDTEHFFIPFFTTGSTVHFASAFPSRWDLDNLPTIQLTAPHWDPSAFSMPNTPAPCPVLLMPFLLFLNRRVFCPPFLPHSMNAASLLSYRLRCAPLLPLRGQVNV